MALFWNKKERTRTTRKYWQRHHRRWEKSGMTQAGYCRKEGISLPSFSNWRSKLLNGDRECSNFIELEPVLSHEHEDSRLELVIPRVGVIRIPETIKPEVLRMILLSVKGID
jgi:hypothetical protein